MNNPIKTSVPARERLIFALDVPDLDQAKKLVATLDDSVMFYKLGLEFFLSGSTFHPPSFRIDVVASGIQ